MKRKCRGAKRSSAELESGVCAGAGGVLKWKRISHFFVDGWNVVTFALKAYIQHM